MLDKSPLQRILKSTLFGVFCGILLFSATFSMGLFPGLIIAISLPFLTFFKELLFEISDAKFSKKKSKETAMPNHFATLEWMPHDVFQKKLIEYKEFFEKKDPITGQPMRLLKHPTTIEGVTGYVHWCITTDKESLREVLYEKTLQAPHPVKKFLCDKSNLSTACYDGYPKKICRFSLFARAFGSKEQAGPFWVKQSSAP